MNEERITKLQHLLEKEPDDSFTRYALALEYAGVGQHENAIALLLDLIRRDHRYVPAYQQLGYAYQHTQQMEHATAILKEGMRVAQEVGDLHARAEMQEALDELDTRF